MITKADAWDIVEEFADKTDGQGVKALMVILDKRVGTDKGTYTKTCTKCGKTFTTDSVRQKVCLDCKVKSQREAERKYTAKKKAEEGRKKPPTQDESEEELDKTLSQISQTAKELVKMGD